MPVLTPESTLPDTGSSPPDKSEGVFLHLCGPLVAPQHRTTSNSRFQQKFSLVQSCLTNLISSLPTPSLQGSSFHMDLVPLGCWAFPIILSPPGAPSHLHLSKLLLVCGVQPTGRHLLQGFLDCSRWSPEFCFFSLPHSPQESELHLRWILVMLVGQRREMQREASHSTPFPLALFPSD